MFGRFANTLRVAVVSLCLTVVIIWILSHFITISCRSNFSDHVTLSAGSVRWTWLDAEYRQSYSGAKRIPLSRSWTWHTYPPFEPEWLPYYKRSRSFGTGGSVPLWIPMLMLGVPAGASWWRRRRRVRSDTCTACQYSLSGLATGCRCPECGETTLSEPRPQTAMPGKSE